MTYIQTNYSMNHIRIVKDNIYLLFNISSLLEYIEVNNTVTLQIMKAHIVTLIRILFYNKIGKYSYLLLKRYLIIILRVYFSGHHHS